MWCPMLREFSRMGGRSHPSFSTFLETRFSLTVGWGESGFFWFFFVVLLVVVEKGELLIARYTRAQGVPPN